MPTERSKAMAERRARREGEEAGRTAGEDAARLDSAARGAKPGWYDKKALAAYFGLSISFVEKRMAEGLPHAVIGRRTKFRVEEVEPWLEQHGWIEWKGDR